MSKSINKLTTMLSEVLSSTLQQNDIESVMEAWNERKSDVSKLFDGVSSGRVKRRKDPNAPKKWKTGYILFCVDQRDKLKSENGTLSATEITSRLGAQWKNLSEKEKAKYEVLSNKDKVRYENDMSSYNPPESTSGEQKGRRSRVKGERTGPKRPLSSYMYFCQDQRDAIKTANPTMNGKEITSELGRVWKSLSDEAKIPHESKAATDKLRFETEKSQLAGAKSETKPKSKAKESKAEPAPTKTTKSAKAPPAKAEAPAKSSKASKQSSDTKKAAAPVKKSAGFDCFCEEQTEDIQTEFPDWNKRKIAAELQKRWQELSPDDQEAYEMEAGENLEEDE